MNPPEKDPSGRRLELIEEITLLKKRIEALEESEARFRAIATYSRDWECFIDNDGRLLWTNPAVLELTGYSIEECMDMRDFPLPCVVEADREMIARVFSSILADQYSGNDLECRLLCKDGSMKWASVSWCHIYDDRGSCIGHRSSIRDITARKDAEEKYREIFENAVEGIFQTTPEGRFISVNPALARMFGYASPKEFIDSVSDMSAQVYADPKKRLEHLAMLEERGVIRGFETFGIKKDGSTFWGSISSRAVRDDAGNVIRYEGFVQDITARKRMEEELTMHRDYLGELVAERTAKIREETARRRQKEEQYLALVESITEWVWETDVDFSHTYISSRVFDILGYRSEDIIGKSPFDFMPRDEAERTKPLLIKLFSEKQPFRSLKHLCLHKNGSLHSIEANGLPFFDREGNLLGYRGSCRDVTEQTKTMDTLMMNEEELKAKSEALEEVNSALKVLLNQRDEDRKEMEETFLLNVRELVLPYVNRIQRSRLGMKEQTYLDIIKANLNEITASFSSGIRQYNLTPKEIEVASHIKDGRTTKEIAELMGVASSAIDSHRNNIRKKLGLNNKKVNLRSHLFSMK